MNYRIGIIGAGGTGKTTLATQVEKLTGFKFWPSIVRSGYQELKQDYSRHLDLSAIDRWKTQRFLIERKFAYDQANPNGIFDRTALDHLMYCMMYCHEAISDSDYDWLIQAVQENLANYDHLFYCPLYRPWPNIHDGFRDFIIANRETQDVILRGLILKLRLPVEQMENVSVEDRLEHIIEVTPLCYK